MKRYFLAALALCLIVGNFVLSKPVAAFSQLDTIKNVFYITPIDEYPKPASYGSTTPTSSDATRMQDLKTRLIPNGDGPYVKVGWSTSIWYMGGLGNYPAMSIAETKNAAADYAWDADARTAYKLNLTKTYNLPILFHMNGGHWGGSSPLVDYLSSDNNRVEWDQNNTPVFTKAVVGSGPIDGQYFSLSRLNTALYTYKKRNLQQAIAYVVNFDQANPGLVVGVSLDSETIHASGNGDYNPFVIEEWRQWLQGTGIYGASGAYAGQGKNPSYTSIAQFNTAMGTSFSSFAAIDPPRSNNGSVFWQEWQHWQKLLVDHHTQDMADWIQAAGMPAERIFSHEIAPSGLIDSFQDDPSVANLTPQGLGITTYGSYATNNSIFQLAKNTNSSWGIFETNPTTPGNVASYTDDYNSLQYPWDNGAQVVCPNAWGWSDTETGGYNIRGTNYETAIKDFVNANKNTLKPYFPMGGSGGSGGTIDQNNASGTFTNYNDIRSTNQRLQAFTVTSTTLPKIDIWSYKNGNPAGDLVVKVYAFDSSNNPTGSPLYTGNIAPSAVSATPGWITVNTNLTGLTPGGKYGFILSSPGTGDAGLTNTYGFGYSDSNVYPQGAERYSSNSGTSWATEANRSLKFITYSSASGGTIDQNNSNGTFTNYNDLRQSYQRLQTFTITGTTLPKIDIWSYKNGSPAGNLVIKVYAFDGSNNPTGSALFTVNIAPSSVSATPGWITLNTNLTGLTAGGKYGFILSSPTTGDAGLSNTYGFGYNDSNLYPQGVERFSNNGGTSWSTEASRSLKFISYK
ncbi:hypothetical protein A8709_21005 [Paenibacillus pectinilyticus]|uniref:Uncharacterized protein n=1 Tax=Paenibacillus pectinilyticus TaxID=512399 RepID=A0A1C0ZXJ8_9BACL|nr:hypothetical protein [Paenibacillus pectinilyticus]OCT12821.1 hypothetical protein A8709_21005 [Paenibacillus pectinilyticus]